MKKLLLSAVIIGFLWSCNNAKKEVDSIKDTKVMLRADTVNVVKLTDTLVIYESTCRGCAYEQSTHFEIKDSLDVIKLLNIITTDNNPPDMAGGSVSKDLILIPVKTGSTIVKLFKFWERDVKTEDSARFTPYKIEVRN
ncbi:MAG: hypothetical protein KA428_12655 [Chitinophagaceae bacterium]|nr:hypothetical protein [Chitinophagaceae bacterium]